VRGTLAARRVLVTPAGMSKVDLRPADLVEIALDGSAPRRGGDRSGRRASTEVGPHLRIYARRPDAAAVVHAHPPAATGSGVAGEGFMAPVLPEIILQVGGLPLVPYATPGTTAVADAFEPFLDRHDAFLMANHGATTVGPSLRLAHQRMESLEHVARIILTARLLGRVRPLPEADAAVLHHRRAAATPRLPTTGPRRASR
jgi:L-fuculose-phosphate aldolase